MNAAGTVALGTIRNADLLCGSCGLELIGGFVTLLREAYPRPVFQRLTLPCSRCQTLNISPEVPDVASGETREEKPATAD